MLCTTNRTGRWLPPTAAAVLNDEVDQTSREVNRHENESEQEAIAQPVPQGFPGEPDDFSDGDLLTRVNPPAFAARGTSLTVAGARNGLPGSVGEVRSPAKISAGCVGDGVLGPVSIRGPPPRGPGVFAHRRDNGWAVLESRRVSEVVDCSGDSETRSASYSSSGKQSRRVAIVAQFER